MTGALSQARHGRLNPGVLPSGAPPYEIEDRPRIVLRSLLIRIVPALREDRQFTPGEVSVKGK